MGYFEFRVNPAETGRRLRDVLADRLQVSGRRAKMLLDARQVFVDGRRVWMASHELTAGNQISVVTPEGEAGGQTGPAVLGPAGPGIRILHEDDQYLIVEKPAGMLTNGENSLETRLREERGDKLLIAAHRLDADTTGCLLVARGKAAFEAAIELFRTHDVTKEYRVIVAGRFHPPTRVIDEPIEGQRAVTRVRAIAVGDGASYLDVNTLTGRTHQIRRHLAGLRHPVLGDRQYGLKHGLDQRAMRIPRQMLHAFLIRFTHPQTGAPVRVQSRLPSDFRACLSLYGIAGRG